MNILVIPYCNQLGSTHTLISIAKHLQKIGHNVWVGGMGKYIYLAKDNGLKEIHIPEIPIDVYRAKTDTGSMNYLTTSEIEDFIDSELEAYKKYGINLVISTLRPSTAISAKMADIKHITLNYSFLTPDYKDSLKTPESHFLYNIAKIPIIGDIFDLLVINAIYPFFKKAWAKEYNIVLKNKGMKKFKDLFYSYCGNDLTWLYDIPEFAPIKNKPKLNYQFVGHLFNEVTAPEPEWLDEMLEYKKETGKPVLFVSMGSSGTLFPKVYEDAYQYARDNNMILMATACDHLGNNSHSEEEFVFLTNFANMRHLIEASDIVVSHGGRGTMYDVISLARNIIIIPHQAEQEANARKIEKLKLGFMVSKEHYTQEELYEKLDDFKKHQKEYKENVKEFSKYFKNWDWKEEVKNSIENL